MIIKNAARSPVKSEGGNFPALRARPEKQQPQNRLPVSHDAKPTSVSVSPAEFAESAAPAPENQQPAEPTMQKNEVSITKQHPPARQLARERQHGAGLLQSLPTKPASF